MKAQKVTGSRFQQSPTNVAPDELFTDEIETIQSLDTQVPSPLEPLFTRVSTPSPKRESINNGSPIIDHMHVSPERFNEAPNTNEQSAGGAEDPITLTSVYDLLNRYVKEVDNLRKELADTKSSLGGQIEELNRKVLDLETELGKNKQRKNVVTSDEAQGDVQMDPLELLAEVAQQENVSSPKVAAPSQSKVTIQFSRKRRRPYLSKSVLNAQSTAEVALDDGPSVLEKEQVDIAAGHGHTSSVEDHSIDCSSADPIGVSNVNVEDPAPHDHVGVSIGISSVHEDIPPTVNTSNDEDVILESTEASFDEETEVAVNDDLGPDLISEQEREEQARLMKEFEDLMKKKSLAEKLTAQFTTNLPPEKQKALDAQAAQFTNK